MVKAKISMLLILVLLFTGYLPGPAGVAQAAETAQDVVIVDNGDPGYSESSVGTWSLSSLKGYNNSSTRVTNSGEPGIYAQWTPSLTAAGTYKVSIYKVMHSSTDPNAMIEIRHAGFTETTYVNYQTGTSGWFELGTYYFDAGVQGSVKLLRNTPNTNIRADAVRFEKVTVSATAALTSPGKFTAAPVDSKPAITFTQPMDRQTLHLQNIQ